MIQPPNAKIVSLVNTRKRRNMPPQDTHSPMDVDAMTAFSLAGLSLCASCPRTAAAVPLGLAVLVIAVICAPVFVLALWSGAMTDVVKELGASLVRLMVDLSPELPVVCVS